MKKLLQTILDEAPMLKIAVIGDFIEDRYVIGEVDRISPEAPVPVVRVTNFKSNPGGAGNVFMNLLRLGVDAHIFCDIAEHKYDLPSYHRWFHSRYPHCVKTRLMADSHHIVRFDEDIVPVYRNYSDMNWRAAFESRLQDFDNFDCVIISDYHKGVVSEDVAQNVIKLCGTHNIPVIVDAKKDYHKFKGATLIKCNGKEWAQQEYRNTDKFLTEMNVGGLVITHGLNGLEWLVYEAQDHIRPHKVPVVDVCGAGDTVTAILGLMIRRNFSSLSDACEVANRLAAEVCKHPGVYPIQREDLIKIIDGEKVH